MMRQLNEVLRHLESDYTRGYGELPIPSAIDGEVDDLVTALVVLDADQRRALLSKTTAQLGFVFLAFAERMAARAVRDKQPRFITQGLSATAVAATLVYIKEPLPIVSLLYRSAEKLGLDPRPAFAGATGLGNREFDRFLEHFPDRSEEDRGIAAMGYIKGEDQDGFRYVRTW